MAALERIGREKVDVEFEGVGPGLLDQRRVAEPSCGRDAVQGANDGKRRRFLDLPDAVQILIRAERELAGTWEVGQRLRERVSMRVQGRHRTQLFVRDLLLEQGMHHDRGGSSVLEALDLVEIIDQRRRARHQGVRELEAQV